MTQIMVDVKPETAQHIHTLLAGHPGMTFGQLAGSLIDARIAWSVEQERMAEGVRAAHPDPYGGGAGFPQGGDA